MSGPSEEELDAALVKWRADNAEDSDDEDGASAGAHDKLQKRAAEDEKRRKEQK